MDAPGEYLPWDSEFFGHRIARVVCHRLSSSLVQSILSWCAQNEIECLYFLGDSDHDDTTVLADQNAFHLVDVRMTLILSNPGSASTLATEAISAPGIQIRAARSSDIPRLETIARTVHEDTRFYYDHHFPRSRCSELYATWIRRSCEGFAEQVLVAEQDGEAVGYLTCTRMAGENALGNIGLVGVDSSVRGMGIGPALVNSSLRWFAERGVQEVRVVTQGRNVLAQRMYQRRGFVTHSVRHWYHKWFGLGK